jgi:hypothetical protein
MPKVFKACDLIAFVPITVHVLDQLIPRLKPHELNSKRSGTLFNIGDVVTPFFSASRNVTRAMDEPRNDIALWQSWFNVVDLHSGGINEVTPVAVVAIDFVAFKVIQSRTTADDNMLISPAGPRQACHYDKDDPIHESTALYTAFARNQARAI